MARKSFKINKNSYTCLYTFSNSIPQNSSFPDKPQVGDVHKDVSTGNWWVWRTSHVSGPPRWIMYTNEFAFEHPASGPQNRYTWNTRVNMWKPHSKNKDPVATNIEGVEVMTVFSFCHSLLTVRFNIQRRKFIGRKVSPWWYGTKSLPPTVSSLADQKNGRTERQG